MAAAHEIEFPVIALELPAEPQDRPNAAKVNEVQIFQVNCHGLGRGMKPLVYGRGEIDAIGCFHPPLGPRDQPLPLF